MREIRFRAWHKFAKEMLYMDKHTKLTFYWDSGGWLMDDGITRAISKEVGILMQYTGLHDKNGKEIYEGDIVTHSSWGGKKVKGEVIWHISGFAVKARGEFAPYDFSGDWQHSKVIGDIYSNPELLKEVKI